MLVEEGDQVKLGQPLFEDKKNPGVFITSPAGGSIESINRGNRRVLQSIVIEVDSQEEFIEFNTFSEQDLLNASPDSIREQLISSGMWTAFRTRPYSKIPNVETSPSNIFISALDTQPLSPNPESIINLNKENFNFGIVVLKQL
jgi:Na+-transporting NADH:ubiquinone oxidoreductase subunit A